MPSTAIWRRERGWVHRVVPGAVLAASRDGGTRTMEGLAVPVWITLDEPGSPTDVVQRLRAMGVEVTLPEVTHAIEVMQGTGLVVVAGDDG